MRCKSFVRRGIEGKESQPATAKRNWRSGRKSRHLQQFGIDGTPQDLLHALAAFRMHRQEKNFDKACTSSVRIAGKAIYKDERKWQAAIRKARHTLQSLFPAPN